MVIGVGLVGGLVIAWLVSRRRRKVMLAGLNGSRPVFSVEPPSRRVAKRKYEAL